MGKAVLLLSAICVVSVLEQCMGLNYYWPAYPDSQDFLKYPPISPVSAIWQPDCDKSKESKEEGSSESSSSASSSSESTSKESKESEEPASSSEESKGSSEESKESSSSEEKGGKKESAEGSEEKTKEEPKKKKAKKSKSLFPPPYYTFPARQMQQIMYSPPASSYAYMPYRTSYLVQQPISSYPVKTNYQYISVPISATGLGSYSAPVVSNNPVAKLVYSPSVASYPPVSKTVVAPGARVYSVPASYVSYFKK